MKVVVFRERAGVLADVPVWVCFWNCRMACDESLFRLVWTVARDWDDDRYLVG